jgi:hypothetical protein
LKVNLFVFGVLSLRAMSAAPITGLFNTGQSTTGSADNHWTVVAPPGAGQVISPVYVYSTWLPNTAASSWEWVTNTGQPSGTSSAPVTYTFRTLFILDSTLNPATAVITGRWATDNVGTEIQVNGLSFDQTSPGFNAWSGYTLNSGFVAGLNVLDFVVQDYGVLGGIRIEFSSADADLSAVPSPEPATSLLLGVALVALGVRYKQIKTPGTYGSRTDQRLWPVANGTGSGLTQQQSELRSSLRHRQEQRWLLLGSHPG